jgi:crossover junction endodeoxyribonuclease RuvC
MRVLGIDPGTATTGYGIVEDGPDGELRVVAYGTVLTPSDMPMADRLRSIFEQINGILLLHQPDCAAVEKLFFYRNVTTAMAVGQARGVALLCLSLAGVPLGEYTPMEVKHSVSGYGNADKKQVQQMVKVLLRMEETPKPDDAADALAVAMCHHRVEGMARLVRRAE